MRGEGANEERGLRGALEVAKSEDERCGQVGREEWSYLRWWKSKKVGKMRI